MKKKIISVITASLLAITSFVGCQKEQPKTYINPELEIAFLGDSITAGATANGRSFCTLMREEDYVTDTHNHGVSGSTIGKSYDSFATRYYFMKNTVNVIFVFGGTNDYGSGGSQAIELGKKGDKTNDTFYGALEMLISGIQRDYSDAELYFITPLQRDDTKWGFPTTTPYNQYGYTLLQYRNAIIDMCESYHLKYLDFYNLEGFRLQDDTFDDYFSDGLHPNQEGHRIIAQEIDKFLRSEYNWKKKS